MADQLLPVTDSTETVLPVEAPEPLDPKEVEKSFRSRLDSAKRNRKKFTSGWKHNVDLRLGQAIHRYTEGVTTEDDLQNEINPDWSLTKTKTANLYSQVPQVQVTHENAQFAPAIPPFAKALNYELGEKRANVGVAMEEVLNDAVNAAGIGAVIVGYAARFETVDMPVEEMFEGPQGPVPTASLTPEQMQQLATAGLITIKPTERTVDDKFFVTRVSPPDLLWPAEFTGSCFDDGDWIGYDGKMSWPEAKNEWKLSDDLKDKATSGSDSPHQEDLRADPEKAGLAELKVVKYSRIFYWRYKVDSDEKSFHAIWELVFVEGIEKAVLHAPWKGQKYDEQTRTYVGSSKFPVRVLTLTYVSDNPIPPSDSAAGRPHVRDLQRSRSQMFQNRDRSVPIRWFDTNRIDPEIRELLQRGTWQGMIPTQGDGTRSIGEIARASYPAEDLAFDRSTKGDLMESWQIGPNQQGTTSPGDQTKAEVQLVQGNFATRIGQERARVASFFLSIAEVLAGWMTLYSDFPTLSDQERQQMQGAWDQKRILHDLVLKIRPDSSIVLDSQQRVQRLMAFLNMTAKSGYVNVAPIIAEIAELTGLDPASIMIKPGMKEEKPNVSYRYSGKDDLINPVVMAMLIKEGLAPSEQEIEAAKKLLMSAQMPPPLPQPAPGLPGQPEAAGPLFPPGQGPDEQSQPPVGEANPDWNLMPHVAKRSRDITGG